MSAEGLDCWDNYPMEHGCICGNDCEPPAHFDRSPSLDALIAQQDAITARLGEAEAVIEKSYATLSEHLGLDHAVRAARILAAYQQSAKRETGGER